MKCVCRYCGKELGDFSKHGVRAMKNRASNYDMYYFCKDKGCITKYLDNGEKPLDQDALYTEGGKDEK